MITLTLSVPNNDQAMAAGFDQIKVLRSSTQTAAGPYTAIPVPIPLVTGTTSYAYTDFMGSYADWYETEFYKTATGDTSSPSAAQPAYVSDMCNSVRDLLGVTTVEASDSQIQGFAYLGAALARVRDRLPSFDTLLAGGGDPANLCLAALAHYTAALLCPRMTVQVLDAIQIKDYREQRNRQMDWTATQAALMQQYELLISMADQEIVTDAAVYIPPMGLAGPTRAGFDTSGGLFPLSGNEANGTDGSLDSLLNQLVPYEGNTDPIE